MSERQTDERAEAPAAAPVPPRDYRIVLPEGWFRIGLGPEERDGSIRALVEQQFNGIDDAPHIKQEMRRDLERRARNAYGKGGIELFLSMQPVGPVTIPASLLVTLAPPAHAEQLLPEELAQSLTEDDVPEREVSVGELTSGRAVRVRSRAEPGKKDAMNGYPTSVSVDYYLPVPDSYAYLLLTFATPLEPIADAMTELFDAVANSLTWIK